jgi:hypothetical protein
MRCVCDSSGSVCGQPLSRHKIFAKMPYAVVNHVIDFLRHRLRSFSIRHMRPLLDINIDRRQLFLDLALRDVRRSAFLISILLGQSIVPHSQAYVLYQFDRLPIYNSSRPRTWFNSHTNGRRHRSITVTLLHAPSSQWYGRAVTIMENNIQLEEAGSDQAGRLGPMSRHSRSHQPSMLT